MCCTYLRLGWALFVITGRVLGCYKPCTHADGPPCETAFSWLDRIVPRKICNIAWLVRKCWGFWDYCNISIIPLQ